MPGDIPFLCGDGSVERSIAEIDARERAERDAKIAAYKKNCTLCELRGGNYLESIYTDNFKAQDTIAARYLNQIARAGGRESLAFGVIINTIGGKGSDFTYLEDVVGYYLLATSRKWKNRCYGPGTQKVTFTTTHPKQIYETIGGVNLGSDPGITVSTHYMVKPEFAQACQAMCNKNGGILLTARLAGGSRGKMAAIEVFKGIDEMLVKHRCDSRVVKRFERNLLSMWAKEKGQPKSISRNTIGSYFR